MDKTTEEIIDDLVNTLPIAIDKKKDKPKLISPDEMDKLARQIYDKNQEIAKLTQEMEDLKKKVKSSMLKSNIDHMDTASFSIQIKTTADTLIADTAALKADGIFSKYSKIKKGYTSLYISPL